MCGLMGEFIECMDGMVISIGEYYDCIGSYVL